MPDPGATRQLGNDVRYGLSKHGVAGPRGQVAPLPGRGSRFGRMFPELVAAQLDKDALDKLGAAMTAAGGDSVANLDLPAGYTYLSQFVDHDLTFDPNSRLATDNDPYTLVDFRTPRLDLDSLYGSGPMDHPFLYRWNGGDYPGVKLLLTEHGGERRPWFDLPRNSEGRALTGDPRNDENLIISQLHTLFLRFHNRAVDDVLHGDDPPARAAVVFEQAQRLVVWTYQWLVLNDLLPRIVGTAMKEAVLHVPAEGPAVVSRRYFRWGDRPYMPVEFSGAVYRFGHSLVREDYKLRDGLENVPVMLQDPHDPNQLGGFRPLPRELVIDWRQFFPMDPETPPQTAMSIDPYISPALSRLLPDGANLVTLNLRRGRALGLPAGGAIARVMGEKPLTAEELLASPIELDDATAKAVVNATPLWFYILREAEARHGGKTLGKVGGRIVAETLAGLVQADPSSYLRQDPGWTPTLEAAGKPIRTMADLVSYVVESDAEHG